MVFYRLRKIKNQPVWWRLLLFLVCLVTVWSPFAIALNSVLAFDPNLATIVIMGLLFLFFLILQKLWGKYIYRQDNIFIAYGLRRNWLSFSNLFKGLAIGFCFCWSLFITEAILGWVTIQKTDIFLGKVVLEGLLSALGIALAEELVFRGWILSELEKDCHQSLSLWWSAILFAIAHFLKPLTEIIRTAITFPALLLLGLTLVWAKRKYCNYLTICIGLHGGLVWGYYILNVGNLIVYTDRVPNWITGIDGNPIAGVLGLSFMIILASVMKQKGSFPQN